MWQRGKDTSWVPANTRYETEHPPFTLSQQFSQMPAYDVWVTISTPLIRKQMQRSRGMNHRWKLLSGGFFDSSFHWEPQNSLEEATCRLLSFSRWWWWRGQVPLSSDIVTRKYRVTTWESLCLLHQVYLWFPVSVCVCVYVYGEGCEERGRDRERESERWEKKEI